MINIYKINKLDLPGILIVFFLPFSLSIPNIVIPLGIAALFYKMAKKNKIIFKPILPFVFFYLFIFILFLFKGLIVEDFKILQRISIVIISALIILNTRKKDIVNTVILSVILSIIYSVIKAVNYFYLNSTIDLSNGEIVYDILLIERPYFGFILLISSLLVFDKFQKNEINKKLAVCIIFIKFFIVFFIAARLTIITFFLITIWYFFKFFKTSFIYKILTLSLFTILILTLLSLNKNFKNRLKIDEGVKTFVDYEPRFVIWPCVVSVLNEDYSKLIFGPVGFESGTDALKKCYSTSIEKIDKREWYLKREFNAHNQFLAVIMISGFLGLFMFIIFLFQLYKSAENNFLYQSMILGLLLFFLLECVLYRQLGCYIIGLIISLVSKKNE